MESNILGVRGRQWLLGGRQYQTILIAGICHVQASSPKLFIGRANGTGGEGGASREEVTQSNISLLLGNSPIQKETLDGQQYRTRRKKTRRSHLTKRSKAGSQGKTMRMVDENVNKYQ
jgi:hypothetical protein